jgi:hypothetical protein
MTARAQALLIQAVALLLPLSLILDGERTLNAVAVSCVLFWFTFFFLSLSHRFHLTRFDLLFLRWGLLAFVLIGTPLLRPAVERWMSLLPCLEAAMALCLAVLLVVPLMYLVTRVFGLRSPFDGTPPAPDE